MRHLRKYLHSDILFLQLNKYTRELVLHSNIRPSIAQAALDVRLNLIDGSYSTTMEYFLRGGVDHYYMGAYDGMTVVRINDIECHYCDDWDDAVDDSAEFYVTEDIFVACELRSHNIAICRYCGGVAYCNFHKGKNSAELEEWLRHAAECAKKMPRMISFAAILAFLTLRATTPYRTEYILAKYTFVGV